MGKIIWMRTLNMSQAQPFTTTIMGTRIRLLTMLVELPTRWTKAVPRVRPIYPRKVFITLNSVLSLQAMVMSRLSTITVRHVCGTTRLDSRIGFHLGANLSKTNLTTRCTSVYELYYF